MKIIQVMAGGEAGGAEMAYVDLCIAQHNAGWDVTAVCRPNKQRNDLMRQAGVPVYELPFGGLFDFYTKQAMRRLFKKLKPDIVQCWMSRAAAKTPNPTKVVPFKKLARLGGYYNLKYYKGVEHFIGNTPDIKRWLIEENNVNQNNVTYINNFAEFSNDDKKINRSDMDTTADDFVFLSMARLHHVKGLDTALKALAKTKDGILWLAGAGPEEENLKSLAKDLNVQDRVRFLGWRTDRQALFEACDCVLFPSRFEPFGGTFAQAWGSKRPLITTASEGPSQYVTHEQDALVVPIDDVDAMAKAMDRVIQDENLRDNLVQEGYQNFQELFTIQSVLNQYDQLYRKVA